MSQGSHCVWPWLLDKAKNKTNKTVDIWTKYWTRQNNGRLGMHHREGGTSSVSNYSIRPPIRFEIPQSWTNLLLFYFYKWPCGGGRRLSSNKVDGCWLDYNPEIFVSAIICQVLSAITSNSDIGPAHYALPGLVIIYKSDRRLSWSLSQVITPMSISVICDTFFANLTQFKRSISATILASVISHLLGILTLNNVIVSR